MRGLPTHELAEHNAKVARAYNRHMVGHVWEVVRCVYGRPPPREPPEREPPPPPPAHTNRYAARHVH